MMGTPAFLARALKKRAKFRGSIGVPYLVVRTKPDPIEASPAKPMLLDAAQADVVITSMDDLLGHYESHSAPPNG